ncbi:hypothetical protein tb265_36370 [Gemmatimonadetes bacterium T265]|nr:hypothetical protein tb265_36370 [Gemmatimonadetes bacterium T265]
MVSAAGCASGHNEASLAASMDASAAQAAERASAVDVAVGDRVRVKVWREAQYSDEYNVDAAGEIVLPRLGPVNVTGLTIGALQDTLRARYAVYLRDPAVTVTVLRRVGLQGEVRAPGLYYVDPTVTMRDVIAQGGGLTEAANPGEVEVIRNGRHLPVTAGADRAPLADLRSGDAIIVGRRSWLSRNALAAASTLGVVVSVAVQVFRR